MGLSWQEYSDMGGTAIGEAEYEAALAEAEETLGYLTLGRFCSPYASRKWEREEKRATYVVLEALPALHEAWQMDTTAGAKLTSFSNGVDSYGFGTEDESAYEALLETLRARVVAILPVELCSACVVWGTDARLDR